MGVLQKIFEPMVAASDIALDKINVVAFDTMGTLVRAVDALPNVTTYEPQKGAAELFDYLSRNCAALGLSKVIIVSGNVDLASKALKAAGLEKFLDGSMEDKITFYAQADSDGSNVLAVDDEATQALLAQAYINPNTHEVRQYLAGEDYKNALNFG